jgi:aspartate-semialdehyde dehydrogenase
MIPSGYRLAVVGATGAVGAMVLQVLEERRFPVAELIPFASPRSAGRQIPFANRELVCAALDEQTFDGFDFVIFSAGGSVSKEWAPKFAATGAMVIDKSSAWREQCPLVVAGVNDDALETVFQGEHRNIIASPNCSTMQLTVALKPIFDAVGIEEIVIATYQSVSGTGNSAITELKEQSQAILDEKEWPPQVYPHQIAFNVLPEVEEFDPENGYTGEELKLIRETRRILGVRPDQLAITATCARVPVFRGHSEAVRIRTARPLSAKDCRELLEGRDGLKVVDDPERHRYPLATEAVDRDEVFVGRIRNDLGPDADRCLNMWIVGDNLRKGAATNAVQIAEKLISTGLMDRRPGAAPRRGARTAAGVA